MNLVEVVTKVVVVHIENSIVSIFTLPSEIVLLVCFFNLIPKIFVILIASSIPLVLAPGVSQLNDSMLIIKFVLQTCSIKLR